MKKLAILIICLTAAASSVLCIITYKGVNSVSEAQSASSVDLPIVMYHSVLKSSSGKYTIHPDKLDQDFARFKELGYTPVFLTEVVAYVDGKGTLPEKPMVITFDDGHYNNLFYALPIAQKHGCKIVINPVTSFSKFSVDRNETDNPSYSYLSWENIRTLVDSGLVEIGNHTHALHKFKPRYGIAQVTGEDASSYRSVLKNDIMRAQELLTAAGAPAPITFAYPFGRYTKDGHEVLSELGFRAMLTCNEGISKIRQGDSKSLAELKRYNRSGKISTEEFIKKVFKVSQ